jgi:DNA-binding MarR family transcriptional regulator
MEQHPGTAVIRAWTMLVRAEQRVMANIECDLKAARLPPLAWYDLLLELRRVAPEGLRPLAIEARLLLAQPNVSRLIARLERKGLVERRPCPDDGRGQLIGITTAGVALLDQMWQVYRAAIQAHVGDRLGDEAEAEALAAGLARLAAPHEG